ncbi:hypothetical protein C9374_009609 [Naegleria lovaniensis]|uniref:Mediator of RNA polymerase II transcription subunit 13 n=1 Tax=Naegleria lovaniensis TaxID=51637 RepID=A0AA88H515_NAELO|nr:uncharacterized protein C9374_009609 [Naegleria lovaniensis]KAG2393032.1 hypothetical protein C9374_009609 [Naegleria lovaniensis]
MLTNTFEINCNTSSGHDDNISFELWKISGELTRLHQLVQGELNKQRILIPYALLVPNELYLFFFLRHHLSRKEKIQSIINDNNLDVKIEKKSFSDFSSLPEDETKLLTVATKNWIQNTLILEHSYSCQGNFIFLAGSEKTVTSDNSSLISITGFSVTCIVHNNFTLKVFINVKKKMFKKLNSEDTISRISSKSQKTPFWVYTPFRGLPARLTTKDKTSSSDEYNAKTQATVLIEGTPISFTCDEYLLAIENNDQNLEKYFPSYRNTPRQNPPRSKLQQKNKIQSGNTPNNSAKNTKRASNAEASSNGKAASTKKQKTEVVLPAYAYTRKEKKEHTPMLTASPTLLNLSMVDVKKEDTATVAMPPPSVPQSLLTVDQEAIPMEANFVAQKSESQLEDQAAKELTADQFNQLLDSFDWNEPNDNLQPPTTLETLPSSTTIETVQSETTPTNTVMPSPSLEQPQTTPVTSTKSHQDEINEFKQLLDQREAQRRSIQDMQIAFKEENLVYEPQTKMLSAAPNFLSNFIDLKDEKPSVKSEIFANDFISYYSTPSYTLCTTDEMEYPRKTNFCPPTSSMEQFSLLTQMPKEKRQKREKKNKKKNAKKEEIKEIAETALTTTVEEVYDEEITNFDFAHSDVSELIDIVSNTDSSITISDILKQALYYISDDNAGPVKKGELLSFMLDGCWKGYDFQSNQQSSIEVSNTLLESIQIVSRYWYQSESSLPHITNDEVISVLFKISELLTKTEGEENIKGPVNMEHSYFQPLETPTIRVGYMEQWLDSHPEIINEWEKSLLEPYAPPKKINYCVIGVEPSAFNTNDGLFSDLNGFFENLSSIYEMCKLGIHLPIHNELVSEGIIPITYNRYFQPSTSTNIKSQKSQMEEFIEQFQKAAKRAEQGIISFYNNNPKDENVFIYVVFPFHLAEKMEEATSIPMSSMLYHIFGNILDHLQLNISQESDVMPFIHFIDQKIVDEPYLNYPLATLKQISLSVYNKCRRQQKRWNNLSGYFSLLHEPAFVLTPIEVAPDTSRNNRSPFSEIQQQKLTLHCAYSITEETNGEFFVTVVWSDYSGNLLESTIIDSTNVMADDGRRMEAVIQKIHEQSTIYMTSLNSSSHHIEFSWEYTVCKVAPTENHQVVSMSDEELAAWGKIKESGHNGAMYLVSLNDNPTLQFFKNRPSEGLDTSHTGVMSYMHVHEEYGYIISSTEERPQDLLQDGRRQDICNNKSVIEIKLFVKGTEKCLHIGNIRHICKQFYNLSWLSVSPLHPSRYTVLPVHVQLLRNINTNLNRYVQYVANKN